MVELIPARRCPRRSISWGIVPTAGPSLSSGWNSTRQAESSGVSALSGMTPPAGPASPTKHCCAKGGIFRIRSLAFALPNYYVVDHIIALMWPNWLCGAGVGDHLFRRTRRARNTT